MKRLKLWCHEQGLLHGYDIYDAQTADEHLEMVRQLEIDGQVGGSLAGGRWTQPPNEALLLAAMWEWDRIAPLLNNLAQRRRWDGKRNRSY